MNWKLLRGALLIAALALHPSAHAQTYLARVVKMIVPAGAAGPTDLLGRMIANELSSTLGQTVIIENHPGAGGAIGTRDVAKTPPDGHTLLVGNTATLATIPAVLKNPGYAPLKDFAGAAKIMDSFQLLLVRPDLPVKSVRELIAYAKAHPGKLIYAAVGVGNITHLSAELLKKKTGIDFVVLQYKGGGEAMNALMAGQADFGIDNVAITRPLVTSGKLRALAVTSAKRRPGFDLPTMIMS